MANLSWIDSLGGMVSRLLVRAATLYDAGAVRVRVRMKSDNDATDGRILRICAY